MSDISTMEPPVTDAQDAAAQAAGQGRHRGPVSGQDDEVLPHGRHRKPSGRPDRSA
ncbi:hypothetical protein ABZV34_16670 [Streptomyces sp. NPDC005195]|uniref:hypothetical protein n=1 Tax=Streptomyces sp. NPDC005195 TaxID=3154561 RepID=UPI00339F9BD1